MRTLLAATLLFTSISFANPKPLIVHEWGTFTSLQDIDGRTIGGVNVDDEPVPAFVHRLGERKPGQSPFENLSKSLYPGAPSVTMRLETPVIYFYPPDDQPLTLDVTATFHGGLISEYFPNGETYLNGERSSRSPETVPANTRGAITWKNVTINAKETPPATDSHVWLAPRNVPAAASIKVGDEAEKYIFYRGVAHLDSPIRVARTADDGAVTIQNNLHLLGSLMPTQFGTMWLTDFKADGSAAFRVITDQPAMATAKAKAVPATFASDEYSTENVTKLRASMKQALISDGLFPDEAEAMLETWKFSYFKASGQRLFFVVPKQWTDSVLPLTFSKPVEVTRVMMGRIEMATKQQRVIAGQVLDAYKKNDQAAAKQLSESIGRFGTSMVNDERRQRDKAATQPAIPPVAAVK